MLTVVCVLRKAGGAYDQFWVKRLKKNVSKHLTVPHNFVCLSNVPVKLEGVEHRYLTESWASWWSKVELFKPGQFNGPVLYLDLDMMATGDLDPLVTHPHKGLVMLRDCPAFRHVSNSGLMWFDPTANPFLETIFHEFREDPLTVMKEYSGINGVTMFGDQGFIEKTMIKHNQPITKWQDIMPAKWFLEFSYLDRINPIVENNTYDKDARVCYSLGYPKMHNLPDLPIVKAHWENP
jgi:hypothetical protein